MYSMPTLSLLFAMQHNLPRRLRSGFPIVSCARPYPIANQAWSAKKTSVPSYDGRLHEERAQKNRFRQRGKRETRRGLQPQPPVWCYIETWYRICTYLSIKWRPDAVSMMPEISPGCSAKDASSNSFCISPLPKKPLWDCVSFGRRRQVSRWHSRHSV